MKWVNNVILLCIVLLLGCQSYPQGEELYKTYCMNCHMEDGSGLRGLIPPLARADFLEDRASYVPCLIAKGTPGGLVINGRQYREPMPSFSNLNSVELSNLINYINTAWGNGVSTTTPSEVESDLEPCL